MPIPVTKCFTSSDIEDSDHDDPNDFAEIDEKDNEDNFESLSSKLIILHQEDLKDLIQDSSLS